MHKLTTTLLFIFLWPYLFWGQSSFTQDPGEAQFVLTDLGHFWQAYEAIGLVENPFVDYLENGSLGLQDFISGRIMDADNLLAQVQQEPQVYEAARSFTFNSESIRPYYQSLLDWYPYTQFPPVYFVIGANNSGGTSTEHGLIIGVEKLAQGVDLPFLVIHECMHFQQNRAPRSYNLLEQAIIEGSADFIAELVTGRLGNPELYSYCDQRKEALLGEFAKQMYQMDYGDWLYQGDFEDKPSDIGYWVGYQICTAIFAQAADKKLAINRLLNNTDYESLMIESGLFTQYLTPRVVEVLPFANLSREVDFTITELTLVFSEAMNGSSFEPLADEEVAFPLVDVIGYSKDRNSFDLKIALEPGTSYGFKVTNRGFQNDYGFALEECEIRFTTKEE